MTQEQATIIYLQIKEPEIISYFKLQAWSHSFDEN